jgi:peptide/nickel transport system permease protein
VGTLSYLLRRLLMAGITLIGITVVTFFIVSAAPGDPASARVGDVQDPEQSERMMRELRERFHLDEPLHVRYGIWLRGTLTGDLGTSMADDTPVFDKIKSAFWPTLSVNLLGLFLAFVLAVPIGIYSAWHQNGLFDRVGGVVLYALYSIPSYVGAIVLILFVGVKWDALPFRGMVGDDHDSLSFAGRMGDYAAHMAIYVICTTYGSLAYYSRFVRSNLLEVTRQEYIRTAKAKGLDDRTVVLKHAFRNTLIPFVTLLGLTLPVVISGSVILEFLFTWPGLGRLFFNSVLQRDHTVIMALSTATAVLVLMGTLVADLLYGVVDPRVSHG